MERLEHDGRLEHEARLGKARARAARRRALSRWAALAGVVLLAAAGWFVGTRDARRLAALPVTPADRVVPLAPTSPLPAPATATAQRVDELAELETARGRVVLRVVDGVTGAPLPEAWLALPVPTTPYRESDPDAPIRYEVRGYATNPVVIESYWARLFVVAGGAGGYLPRALHLDLGPERPNFEQTIELSRCGELEVSVTDAASGAPVPATVLAVDRSRYVPEVERLFQAATERVRVANRPPDDRVLFPSLPERRAIDALPAAPPALDEVVARLETVGESGWWPEQFESKKGRHYASAPNGRARLALPSGDDWSVVVWPDGPWSHALQDSVAIDDRSVTSLELKVTPVNLVRGRVLREDGTPAAGAQLVIDTAKDDESSDSVTLEAVANEEGRFELPLARREILVIARQEHDGTGRAGVGFGAFEFVEFADLSGGVREIELRFVRRDRDEAGRADTMRGRVLHADGSPAVGAEVRAEIFGPHARTDHDGRFVLHGGFGALVHLLAEFDREAMLKEKLFNASATWQTYTAPTTLVEKFVTQPFSLVALDPQEELVIQFKE